MDANPIRKTNGGVRIDVLVVPNSSRTVIVGVHGDRVKIRLSSAAEDGKANRELVSLIRSATGAKQVSVAAGHTSRWKSVVVPGVSIAVVRRALSGDT